jgi:hypothetical protein
MPAYRIIKLPDGYYIVLETGAKFGPYPTREMAYAAAMHIGRGY